MTRRARHGRRRLHREQPRGRLLAHGVEVVVFDNFSTGRREFVEALGHHPGHGSWRVTCSTASRSTRRRGLRRRLPSRCERGRPLRPRGSDARPRAEHHRHFDRARGDAGEAVITRIVFTSTGSVYGEPEVFPTPEDCPFPVQTSLYGARSSPERLDRVLLRGLRVQRRSSCLVSVLGERYTHGHVFDFYRALRRRSQCPARARKRQAAEVVHVRRRLRRRRSGCSPTSTANRATRIYNIGTDEATTSMTPCGTICDHLDVTPRVDHTGGGRGWLGDSPLIHLDCSRLRALGWTPQVTFPKPSDATLAWFDDNGWVFERERRMSVIFTRAPLRISLGGGGTDLPSYYREHGGFLIAGAIDKYVYMLTHTVFQRRFRLKYSEIEEVDEPEGDQTPDPARGAARHWDGTRSRSPRLPTCPREPAWGPRGRSPSACSRPWRSRAARRRRRQESPRPPSQIEIDILGEPIGKQDTYVSAHGGICAYTFDTDDTRRGRAAGALGLDDRGDGHNLLMFYTGETRDARNPGRPGRAQPRRGDGR